MERRWSKLRWFAVAVTLVSPWALAHGGRVGLAVAALQAMAAGPLLWPVLPARLRVLAVVGPAALLAGLAAGAAHSARDGLLAVAGLGHAMLYTILLALFAGSLLPGRVSLVTRLAMRLNPRFRPGMIPYTRAVTAAWCGFFAAQLAGSAVLLALAPAAWWLLFVGTVHAPMAIALGLAEFAVRRWRFRGEHTGLRETISGMRPTAWRASAATAADASRPAADCPARSGNETRRLRPDADSAPGPAA